MQRDLRGQREAASGDLSERAARKDTGHGITFFRICTFAYRVRENRTWYNIKPNLYVQLPCSRKRRGAPFSNVRLQNRHGVLPNTVRELYMLGRCPKAPTGTPSPEHSITFSGNCTFTCCVPENDAKHHSPKTI